MNVYHAGAVNSSFKFKEMERNLHSLRYIPGVRGQAAFALILWRPSMALTILFLADPGCTLRPWIMISAPAALKFS